MAHRFRVRFRVEEFRVFRVWGYACSVRSPGVHVASAFIGFRGWGAWGFGFRVGFRGAPGAGIGVGVWVRASGCPSVGFYVFAYSHHVWSYRDC